MRLARGWHLLTLVVVVTALVLQTALVVRGSAVLDETVVPPLGTRLFQMVCYFTIQANVLVAIASGALVVAPAREGQLWRVVRADAVLGITLTGVVHFFLLRPLLHLSGWDAVADTLLHLVVPALVILGWLVCGPRPRLDARTAWWSLAWPVAWLAVTLVLGAVRDWYPYPFLDVSEHGLGQVLLTSLGVTLVFLTVVLAMRLAERSLPAAPRESDSGQSV
ncbi:Pr6Pr family membrane protein [Ornithinimicrobium murale]|uniref:Pr6Pr family membrane protein n=1 Tax=Ornithinimicrobium murale TaxID=1050153 RepID=UPI000E0DBB87|nr:Pr6Pr family membrane protein [Ornithinimicrobium murale]